MSFIEDLNGLKPLDFGQSGRKGRRERAEKRRDRMALLDGLNRGNEEGPGGEVLGFLNSGPNFSEFAEL